MVLVIHTKFGENTSAGSIVIRLKRDRYLTGHTDSDMMTRQADISLQIRKGLSHFVLQSITVLAGTVAYCFQ
jgi:hypothetical protein